MRQAIFRRNRVSAVRKTNLLAAKGAIQPPGDWLAPVSIAPRSDTIHGCVDWMQDIGNQQRRRRQDRNQSHRLLVGVRLAVPSFGLGGCLPFQQAISRSRSFEPESAQWRRPLEVFDGPESAKLRDVAKQQDERISHRLREHIRDLLRHAGSHHGKSKLHDHGYKDDQQRCQRPVTSRFPEAKASPATSSRNVAGSTRLRLKLSKIFHREMLEVGFCTNCSGVIGNATQQPSQNLPIAAYPAMLAAILRAVVGGIIVHHLNICQQTRRVRRRLQSGHGSAANFAESDDREPHAGSGSHTNLFR